MADLLIDLLNTLLAALSGLGFLVNVIRPGTFHTESLWVGIALAGLGWLWRLVRAVEQLNKRKDE